MVLVMKKMAQQNSIKILQVSHVTPLVPSSAKPTELSLPLTFLDTFCFKFPPVQCLFFYSHTDSHKCLVNKLKLSLSQTLTHFLPLAGTLTWPENSPKPYVLYKPGNTVSFTVAELSSNYGETFKRFTDNQVIRDAAESHPLSPGLDVGDASASIIAVQVTLFPGTGFCIGITAHHAFLDGKSTAMFMKSWSHVCMHGDPSLPPELTPFFDRSVVNDPNGLDVTYLNRWLAKTRSGELSTRTRPFDPWPDPEPGPDSVRGTFELSRSETDGLKALASKLEDGLSSFVVASAYVITCMVRATSFRVCSDGKDDRKLYIIVGADYRARLDPPVPAEYFGNCAGSLLVQAQARDCFGKTGIAVVAAKMRGLIKGLDKGVLEGAEERLSNWGCLEPDSHVIAVTWSPKFGVYDTDFGCGRPKKVEVSSVHGKAISVVELGRDGSGGGGVEIGLVLKKREMERFASIFRNNLSKILL